MAALLTSNQRAVLATATLAILSTQIPSCSSSDSQSSVPMVVGGTGAFATGGSSSTGGQNGQGGSLTPTGGSQSLGSTSTSASTGGRSSTAASTGGKSSTAASAGGQSSVVTGGTAATGGSKSGSTTGGNSPVTGGTKATASSSSPATGGGSSSATGGTSAASGGSSSTISTGGITATGGSTGYVVAMVQSTQSNASDIQQNEIASLVGDAIEKAGGLGFIKDGTTVVLKPNLLTHMASCWGTSGTTLPATVNGVATDWRVTKAVADLVRAKNPSGKILIMEGSNRNTNEAFKALGYTAANFGTAVDEFIALEGSGCSSRSTTGLIQKAGASGKQYWVNERYFNADTVISIGALKTHGSAGITGCVKNLGIGATPNAMYSTSNNDLDCTRNMSQASAASYIDHGTANLGAFVSDYYSVRPADFAIMDGLQGLQNGPCSSSSADRMNMRLILASKNAVALDTVEALVMSCDPTKVASLTKAAGYGLGTTDITKISVVGKQISDVKKSFKSGVAGVCN